MAEPRVLRGLLGAEEKRDRPERVRAFEADPLLFWRLRAHLDHVIWGSTLVTTNGQGLRYPTDLGPKPPGGLRILCFGDSVTFGYQIPFVRRDHPGDYDRSARHWTAALEARLAGRLPGRSVEVVPMAVPGYSSHQGRAWLERDLASLEADAVVIAFGWNDADLRPATDREAMPAGWVHHLSRRVVLSSQAMLHAAAWLRPRPPPRSSPAARAVPRVPTPQFVENHLAMAREAAALGVPLLVVGPIYRDSQTAPDTARRMAANRIALGDAMRDAGVPYLVVPELTEAGHPGNARLFLEEVHPSAEGHALLAAAVERRLAAAQVFPAPRTDGR